MSQAFSNRPASDVAFLGGDAELVAGLKASNPAAQQAFFRRYGRYVERLARGILGPDGEVGDAMQDAFLAAFRQVSRLRAPEALTEWLRIITIGVARNRIRARGRNRWLSFFAPDHLPEPMPAAPGGEASVALRAVYTVLGGMPVHERVAFTLRYIEDMTMSELAHATGISESTAKRRVRRAEQLFDARALGHPALADWCQGIDAGRAARRDDR